MTLPAANSCRFNPLPRKEGDTSPEIFCHSLVEASIHSLVKRETRCSTWAFVVSGGASIHSLVKRETPRCLFHCTVFYHSFNPLPRKEGDTMRKPKLHWRSCCFNPLPRKEGDTQGYKDMSPPTKASIHSLVKRETQQI